MHRACRHISLEKQLQAERDNSQDTAIREALFVAQSELKQQVLKTADAEIKANLNECSKDRVASEVSRIEKACKEASDLRAKSDQIAFAKMQHFAVSIPT